MFYKKILHATDLQGEHFKTCEKAAQFAKSHQADLYLMHVIEIPNTYLLAQLLGFAELVQPAKEDAASVLKTIADAIQLPHENLLVEIGSVKQHVTEKIKAMRCDLLILGTHMTHSFPDMFGSTASQITRHAECDILIFQ